MAENLTPKKYIDSNNMKQILTAVKNEISNDKGIVTTEAEYLALPEEQKLNNSYYLYDIGVHYKNGVAYSRKKPIQLTMEEYKALGEVDPDQEYIVSADEQGILLEASDIGYSNAVSNLPCTTVQGAIDKIAETSGNVYSTEEKVIGTWIDGKPIYRKVFYSENSAFTNATQFPAPYAEKLVEYSPMYRNDYNNFFPESMKLYNKGQANAYFQETSRSYAGGTYWIAKYTKTTD